MSEPDPDPSARQEFRVLTRIRNGYDGGMLYDVQLQATATGDLVWARTFTDRTQADTFQAELEADLDGLAREAFRSKYSVPSTT